MRKCKLFLIGFSVVTLITILSSIAVSFAEDVVDSLKAQIQTLQKRVEELEAERKGKEDESFGFFNRRRTQRWDPFEEMQRMQEEMDRMLQDSFSWGGATSKGMFQNNMFYDDTFDMKEEKDKYVIEFDMSGLDQEKIDIQINEQSITVRGEYSEQTQQKQKDQYFSSKSYGTFLKSIPVPENADTAKIKSEKNSNKLIIILPKNKSM